MDYRMKQKYFKNNFWSDSAEDEKYFTEYLTRGVFHTWNDKLEILARICDYYSYMFRFYPDGRLVLQTLIINIENTISEWKGKDYCGHLEYENLDCMLIDWLDELRENEGSYKFDEEIAFIEDLLKVLATPMLNRILEVQEQSKICGEFLDWFLEKYTVFEKRQNRETPFDNVMGSGDYINKEKLLAEFFDIDLEEAQREKDLLFKGVKK